MSTTSPARTGGRNFARCGGSGTDGEVCGTGDVAVVDETGTGDGREQGTGELVEEAVGLGGGEGEGCVLVAALPVEGVPDPGREIGGGGAFFAAG